MRRNVEEEVIVLVAVLVLVMVVEFERGEGAGRGRGRGRGRGDMNNSLLQAGRTRNLHRDHVSDVCAINFALGRHLMLFVL